MGHTAASSAPPRADGAPERHTGNLRDGLFSFTPPVSAPEITISMFWHSRLAADPAHRWLRRPVREVCADLR